MSWITIAKKEYLENVRNAWVIAVSALFLALTLLTSYLSRVTSGNLSGTPGFSSIGVTLNGLDSVGGFLLPILAITVGFKVFVCDNLMFNGDFQAVLARKHTKHFDLGDTIALGVERMQRGFAPMGRQIDRIHVLQGQPIWEKEETRLQKWIG